MESLKLGGAPRRNTFDASDITMHPFLDRGHERLDFLRPALSLELDATVRQIAHATCYLEFPGHLQRGVAKADALHVTCEINRFGVRFGHE